MEEETYKPATDTEGEGERAAGQDTDTTVGTQTFVVLAATVVMFMVLIFGWVFAGRLLDMLGDGIKTIGNTIISNTEKVVAVGEVVIQEVLKGTGTVINQISSITQLFIDEVTPLIKQVAIATDTLLTDMADSIDSILSELQSLGTTISGLLAQMITRLGIEVDSAIHSTLGFIQTMFGPFFNL
jgi:Fe2+ transport system protein B